MTERRNEHERNYTYPPHGCDDSNQAQENGLDLIGGIQKSMGVDKNHTIEKRRNNTTTIKEYLFDDWCSKEYKNGQAVEAFYKEYIRPNNDLNIENAFLRAIVEENQRAFYAGMETFSRVLCELSAFNGITQV